MKKVKAPASESPDPFELRNKEQYRVFILQLYEKGLISAKTVLSTFDLDPDEEIKSRQNEIKMMQSLESTQSRPSTPEEANIISTKVENARRNLEALTKTEYFYHNGTTELRHTVENAIVQSIGIMGQVANIRT